MYKTKNNKGGLLKKLFGPKEKKCVTPPYDTVAKEVPAVEPGKFTFQNIRYPNVSPVNPEIYAPNAPDQEEYKLQLKRQKVATRVLQKFKNENKGIGKEELLNKSLAFLTSRVPTTIIDLKMLEEFYELAYNKTKTIC
jgi:hypothetical protein